MTYIKVLILLERSCWTLCSDTNILLLVPMLLCCHGHLLYLTLLKVLFVCLFCFVWVRIVKHSKWMENEKMLHSYHNLSLFFAYTATYLQSKKASSIVKLTIQHSYSSSCKHPSLFRPQIEHYFTWKRSQNQNFRLASHCLTIAVDHISAWYIRVLLLGGCLSHHILKLVSQVSNGYLEDWTHIIILP